MPPAEKMEDGTLPTQRAQPGRQGLSGAPKSWAEMGPPPRSTGILRMWRKDERGPQWTKVRIRKRFWSNNCRVEECDRLGE